MKICIVGAGITGLTTAYELSKKGEEVTILEKGEKPGGIAEIIEYDGFYIEKYYHHFFKSDKCLMNLLSELGLENDIMWLQSRMGFFVDNALYDFGTPISLLKFAPLNFFDKFRFGMSVLNLLGTSNWEKLENITAKDWLVKSAGEKAFNKIWRPLLITKFGDDFDLISMSWMWGKMKLRGKSKENGKEVLGYINGSSKVFIDKLIRKLTDRNVEIVCNCNVNKINSENGFRVETNNGVYNFDKVISTAPLGEFLKMADRILPKEYIDEKSKIKYTGTVCMILFLDRAFTKYYWLNIGDESIPFGGLIEHTNIISPTEYNNNHILYISNYVYTESKYYTMSNDELFNTYIPYLKKINPEFDRSWVNARLVFRDDYAQPVIKLNYSDIKPELKTPVKGLYNVNMCSIYPQDRGVNYAIKEGIKAAALAQTD